MADAIFPDCRSIAICYKHLEKYELTQETNINTFMLREIKKRENKNEVQRVEFSVLEEI